MDEDAKNSEPQEPNTGSKGGEKIADTVNNVKEAAEAAGAAADEEIGTARLPTIRLAKMGEEEETHEGRISLPSSPYYTLSIITVGFFVFLAAFVVSETLFSLIGEIRLSLVAINLAPFGGAAGLHVMAIASLLSLADALLHVFDKKINLMASFVPSGIMLLGLGITVYTTNPHFMDSLWVYLLFVALMAMIILDYICVLNYPELLESMDRAKIEEEIGEEDLVSRLQRMVEEKEREILEEEEKLKAREEELNKIMTELEEKERAFLEEEEKLKQKEEELLHLETELKEREEELLLEEEEKLKVKEEELIKLREEVEVKSKMFEEAQEELRRKETELNALREKLEEEIRRRIEEEERQKMREAAEIMRGTKAERILYPFTAIVNQEKMKRSLILNAINPEIGGVLIVGQKGTGKSVAVRGLAEILPQIEVVEGCRFNCDPGVAEELCGECKIKKREGKMKTYRRQIKIVDLPLNVTEDRLVGSVDIERILSEGVKAFEPGLLAEAHRGILYVDEINLLDDYIVDLLLDAAAMGVNTVEREGLHISHPSRFIIIGSMNPEEGELRPQLIDRIGLMVQVEGIKDVRQRIEIIRRQREFVADPEGFSKKYEAEQLKLKQRIIRARELLPRVVTPPKLLEIIGKLCIDFNVQGHRSDIIIERAARANAAYEGRLETTVEDIIVAAEMALPHRMRRLPLEEEEFSAEMLRKLIRTYMVG